MTLPKPLPSETDSNDVEGRRKAQRFETNVPLRIVIEAQELAGLADNLSDNGVFLFSFEKVSVRIQVDDATGSRSFQGKIVRVQQMNPEETGFAIEFDRE